ncbi:3-beta hydroxysteroid dehydrogenase/isomerase family protein [Streptococcus oralis SK1074]|uniref:NAD-dependent epimerase/dehydratase family protein n=1 Tax=Streptococcus oralis TaxID=1303 RepID=UPI00025AA1A0|nr:NAD(P)-dependent oxidoreductase [Streptococcus oralis]EID25545.1 3-beta hydroxysteroid dehydrogenase/isomerase family protein [Streptococcus oralis SK1074]
MKKVLVTGATGFLGKYVVEELSQSGYQVRAFGRNRKMGQSLETFTVAFFQGDLTKQEDLAQACQEMDMVVHAGALSTVWGPWEDFYQTNVLGTKYVLDACREAGIQRLVYVSSPSIYAAPRDQLAIKESDAPQENNLNNYIRSKLASEKLFKDYPDVPSIILRPRGLFGIGDTSILPRVLKLSQKIGIPLIGDGRQLMDMTCVENVALAIRLALEAPQASGEVYNITNGEPRAFKDLIEETLRGLGYPITYRKVPAPLISVIASSLEFLYQTLKLKGEPALTRYTYYLLRYSQTLDISKAELDLGYRPQISISEGIEQYVQDYRKH